MKVYINREPKMGPWGGGNRVVTELSKNLRKAGIEVVYYLHPGIDIIFCLDPRFNQLGEQYQNFLDYKKTYGTKIIQRIGDLGTHSKPELTNLVRQSMNLSDYIIFPSLWAKEWIGFNGDNHKVINNRPLSVFHKYKREDIVLGDKIKSVTHHWSTNPKKGFNIYKQFDDFLENNEKYEFTYIGRLPDGLAFKNIKHINPINVEELANILPKYDIYITASVEEAGANHVIEAIASGLPVLYHKDGGSIVNYCENYGEEYSSFSELLEKLYKISDNYKQYKNNALNYNETIEQTIEEYVEIICTK